MCEDGFYNNSCMDTCGHCLNGEPCDKHTGQCHNGCQPHFLSPFCKGTIMRRQQNLNVFINYQVNMKEYKG